MRKNNKDYKPRAEYIADQEQKRAVAQNIAAQIHAMTAPHHVDIQHLIGALQRGLLSTWRAAEELGLSTSAFLRLRRKYGLEPIDKEPLWGEPHKMKYLYSPAQLTRIPPLEIELSKRRSAMALRRAALTRKRKRVVFNPAIDLDGVRKLVA